MGSSENTPYFRLLFIAIERGVISISAESCTNLGGILWKRVTFLVLIFLRHFGTSTGLVGSKLKDIDLGVFHVVIALLICFTLGWSWYVRIVSSITERWSLDWFVIFKGLFSNKPLFISTVLI